jgi:hypothetical protein
MNGNPNTNQGGLTYIPAISTGALFVNGKRLRDTIQELISIDQFEASEIQELKQLVQYLNTSGLSSEWIVDNNNKNQDLKSLITALENKTRFISEASVTGTGDNTTSTYTTSVGPPSEEKGISIIEMKQKNAPEEDFIGYRIKSDFNSEDYDDNETLHSHPHGRFTIDCSTMRLKAVEQIRIGNFNEYGDSLGGAVNIGGRGGYVNIGAIDALSSGSMSTQIQIGKQSDTAPNTATRISGNVYLSDARFEDMTKSSSITPGSLFSLLKSGLPGYILGFITGSTNLPLSDVWTMAGGFANTKNGSIETSNKLTLKELYVVNKDIVTITPRIGFFLAKADYSCTQLIGSHRTQVFSEDSEIVLRHNNITSTDVDWAFTEANDKCNVINIKGDDGILIHQGASEDQKPITIVNSCKGGIELRLTKGGTKSGGEGLSLLHLPGTISNSGTETFVRIGTYMGGALGTSYGSYALEVNQYNGAAYQPETARDGMVVAKAVVTPGTGQITQLLNVINADSINTPGTITGINLVGSTSISTNQATATSLVISGNYTGNTDARLYKNADNKLMWNGAEVGTGGASSGGITYMINVPTNITNPHPTPTETIMTAAYSGNAQRTITQAITSNTAYYIAKYTTEVFDETSNPVLTGLQQLNQYISWNSNSQTGQIYGRLWFQATAIGLATLYQRTYVSPVTTTAATFINGTPIPTPKGLYNLKIQRVVFPNINVVVTSGPVVLRFRVEGNDFLNGWVTLATMTSAGQSVASSTNNLSVQLDHAIDINQTSSVGAKTGLRFVLFIESGTGTISQTSAGGADLGAYSLIGLGANTPALFRTMLYDGTNAKIVTPYSETPTLIEYDMAIDAPYNISAFPLPTLSTDLYFIQPAGGFNNHAITLYFNDGSISHFHSSIATAIATPTLANVLNSGATANQSINMNGYSITGIMSLEGAVNGNWNVKDISPGTNIGRTASNGNFIISNTAPVQDIANSGSNISVSITNRTATITNTAPVQNISNNGTNIGVSVTSNTATITNTAPVQNIDNTGSNISVAVNASTKVATISNTAPVQNIDNTGSNINVAINATTKVATISNTAPVQNVTGGSGILVEVNPTTKLATITNTIGAQVTRDLLAATSSVGLVPRKLGHYAKNWGQISTPVKPADIFVSHDGRNCVYLPAAAQGNVYVQYSNDYGATWYNSNLLTFNYENVCGSITGETLYISRNDSVTGFAPNLVYTTRLYKSVDYGITWSEITLDRTPGAANTFYNRYAGKIICNSDGSIVVLTTYYQAPSGQSSNGTLYISANGGTTWVLRSLTAIVSNAYDICMSANGSIMFAAVEGNLAGSSDNGTGGIYRSLDFGVTWARVRTQLSLGSSYFWGLIRCDATGRFLLACDQSYNPSEVSGQIHISDDFGTTWTWYGDEQARGARTAFVSPGGNLMIVVHYTSYNSQIRISEDYGKTWRFAFNMNVLTGESTIRSFASNYDGSLLLLTTTGPNIIYRSFEEKGKIVLDNTSKDFYISNDFGGGYTFLSDPTIVLWYSARLNFDSTAGIYNCGWPTTAKIDLTQFNIRYEIDINYSYLSAPSSQVSYIQMGLNNVTSTSLSLSGIPANKVHSVTNWTNIVNDGGTGTAQEFNQTYRNRFYCGYRPASNWSPDWRNRQRLSGELSFNRRTTADPGISPDHSANSREIINRYTCDNIPVLRTSAANNDEWYIYSNPNVDTNDQHQRIHGTSVWAASAGYLWTSGEGSALSQGIYNISLAFQDLNTTTTTYVRPAECSIRIYRVRK